MLLLVSCEERPGSDGRRLVRGMEVKGVEYGGLLGGRKDCRVGMVRTLRSLRKSSCVSLGDARWKRAGGRSWRMTLIPLQTSFKYEREALTYDVL